MKSTIDDEKLKEKISDSDKEAITSKCDEIIKWLNANQLAEVDEFAEKQKEVEAICKPIVTKLHQDAGGDGSKLAEAAERMRRAEEKVRLGNVPEKLGNPSNCRPPKPVF